MNLKTSKVNTDVMENIEFIKIYLEDVIPFLGEKDAQRVVLRYLHDVGIEGEINEDGKGNFIRYCPPESNFKAFSKSLYNFITSYKKK